MLPEQREPTFKKYVNIISGNEATVLYEETDRIFVKYTKSKYEVWYPIEYFDKIFNPIEA